MKFPWDAAKPLRVEVALNPASEAPAWRDVSALVKGGSGVRITRGGGDRHEDVPPGRCTFTLDNRNGDYSDTSGLAPSLFRKRVRVSYRTPGSSGNLLTAEQSSFEGGTVGGWFGGGLPSVATLTNSSTRAQHGTKSLRAAWFAGGFFQAADLYDVPTTPGYRYVLSAYVWVPTGSPAVQLAVQGVTLYLGTASTLFDAWQRISITWVADAVLTKLSVNATAGTTAGQEVWVDALQLDEGSTVGAFTTSPAPISYRFTGRIVTNDLGFPALGLAETALTATDESAWHGSSFSTFAGPATQEILYDDPAGVWPLTGSTLGDASPYGGRPMVNTGPSDGATPGTGTDGTEFTGGMWLIGTLAAPVGGIAVSSGVTFEAAVSTTATTEGTVGTLSNPYGPTISLTVNADGKPRARVWNVFNPGVWTANVVGAAAINDGTLHHLAATWNVSTATLTLYVDGASAGTATTSGGDVIAAGFVTVGGSTHTPVLTGTVAHVAATDRVLSGARIADHAFGSMSGFTGETVAARVARYNRWDGTPYDTVTTTGTVAAIGNYDTTGKSLTDAIAAVAVAEDGIAYVDGAGALVVRGRAAFINPTTVYTIAGPGDGAANRARNTLSYATNPRSFANDITGTMPGGISKRVVNAASVTDYGRVTEAVDGPFATLGDLTAVIEWRLNVESTPQPTIEGLSVRLSQLDDAATAALLAVDLGQAIAWTGMPAQAPATTDTGVVLGIEETYTHADLLWSATVAPAIRVNVMITDDAVRGLADSGNVAGY